MGWLEAIKAAIIAIPKVLDLFQQLINAIEKHSVIVQDAKIQEIRNAQIQLTRDIERIQTDADRLAMAKRLADLERGIKH